uniref:Solute-binding protein family 3/N-terminal domain-containing protein n=1 Tax=Nitratidesulfovibrio vulgaris (strain DSM 19637 / Miyazaki F) TaxID=883 RepID=B8DL91_NITV9
MRFLMVLLFAALACACMVGASHAGQGDAAPRRLTFVAPWPKSEPEMQRLIRVYTEVFARLGMTFEVLDVPARRASERLENGLVDGDLSRVREYGTYFSNVVRVDEPHHTRLLVAYALRDDIRLEDWSSLARTGLRVECPRGNVSCSDNVTRYVPVERYSENDTVEQGVLRLRQHRVDVYINVQGRVEDFVSVGDDGVKDAPARVHPVGVMGTVTGHMWLHRKHAALAPAIAEILREMKRDGTFARLYGAE